MNSHRRLWLALTILLVATFGVLLWSGKQIRDNAPPMPERVVSATGATIYTRDDIELGREVWQSIGGMQLGSIWGHGAYVAPDWSADALHREAMAILDLWAARQSPGTSYSQLPAEARAALQGRLQLAMRANTWDPASGVITVDADRAAAMQTVAKHYMGLFGNDPAWSTLREAYAMKEGTVPDAEHRRVLAAFIWWTAWATTTERHTDAARTLAPQQQGVEPQRVTYTNNWPGEPLVGNRPPPATWVWSAFSVLFLIAGVALLGWHHAVTQGREQEPVVPERDPMAALQLTPSMQATAKYFWLVRSEERRVGKEC